MTEQEFRDLLTDTQLRAYNAPPGVKEYDMLYDELAPYIVKQP